MDRQSAATGGMAGMQAVACGADQHRGQDRHEAGVAGCPDGLAAAALLSLCFQLDINHVFFILFSPF